MFNPQPPNNFLRFPPSNHRKILCYLLLILIARVCTFQLHFFFISGVLRRRTMANGVGKGEVRSWLCSSSYSFLSKWISHFLFSSCLHFRPPLMWPISGEISGNHHRKIVPFLLLFTWKLCKHLLLLFDLISLICVLQKLGFWLMFGFLEF